MDLDRETAPRRDRARPAATAVATGATAATLLLLDLLWLGAVARPLYTSRLGPLMRPGIFWPAAGLFYALYLGAIVIHVVLPARSVGDAARRGAGLGLVAYGTYELTNWAVLRDWPGALVPADVAWGVALTAVAGAAGWSTLSWIRRRDGRIGGSSASGTDPGG